MADSSQRKTLYHYDYRHSPDQDVPAGAHHRVVVVGAGPVGLTAAIDLALRGVEVVVLDDSDRIGEGSRGICWAKRTLEIWDRLGVGEALVARGVTWQIGKVFLGKDLVYSFDLLPEGGHKMPAFINLQQYHVERTLVERAAALDAIDLRWKNRLVSLEARNDGVRLSVETPEGLYDLTADWVIAADGARSAVRDIASGSIRRSIRGSRRCCIASRTIAGASICNWVRMPISRRNSSPNAICRASNACTTAAPSVLTGFRSIASTAVASTVSCMAE
jgi:3-(3-hydroxy-phenyl)propionate hydroxylase